MKTKKQKVKQQIVAVLVMAFMFVMISGSVNVPDLLAATSFTVATQQNIVAGALNVDSLASIGFPDITISNPANSQANLTVVNMQDWRGNGMGWTLSMTANALTTAVAGTNTIANTYIFVNTGASVGVVSGSATGVATTGAGSWRDLSASRTLVNTASNNGSGMGSYNLSNTMINVVYNGNPSQKAGTYQNLLTLTIATL